MQGKVTLSLTRQELRRDAGGRASWVSTTATRELDASKVALVICDMWDKHWSMGATERVEALVPKVDRAAASARRRGITIVHAPSDTLDFYEGHPARARAEAVPLVGLPVALPRQYPPLPIDDSDGGSDTNVDGSEVPNDPVWRRQHPGIHIDEERDYISDLGSEIHAIFKQKGITTMAIAGVHTNMCVLGRGFAIKQMLAWGVDVVLVRDLTDAMYNPAMPPYVSHDEGTRLVIEYVEKFLCPTITSADIT
ncbi:MAG: isochorismatase family protein [Candidatus Lokiarchaeota archaeon]|nr:isochorismatase family protein [Candidatus Lokiarchaeota archaeon]